MSGISRALALTRANIEMLRHGIRPERCPTGPFEWKNPGQYYWRTPRIGGRFEAMVVKGRDGSTHANVYSYVIFDYANTRCSCVRISKAKSVEEAKARAESLVRVMSDRTPGR